jgi:hypothetical protein
MNSVDFIWKQFMQDLIYISDCLESWEMCNGFQGHTIQGCRWRWHYCE